MMDLLGWSLVVSEGKSALLFITMAILSQHPEQTQTLMLSCPFYKWRSRSVEAEDLPKATPLGGSAGT